MIRVIIIFFLLIMIWIVTGINSDMRKEYDQCWEESNNMSLKIDNMTMEMESLKTELRRTKSLFKVSQKNDKAVFKHFGTIADEIDEIKRARIDVPDPLEVIASIP